MQQHQLQHAAAPGAEGTQEAGFRPDQMVCALSLKTTIDPEARGRLKSWTASLNALAGLVHIEYRPLAASMLWGWGSCCCCCNGPKQPLAAARAGTGGTAAGLDGKGHNWEGSSQGTSADAAGVFTGAEAWQQQQQQTGSAAKEQQQTDHAGGVFGVGLNGHSTMHRKVRE